MRIHLIAIGGSAMHNLAIALKETGHQVTGSDDEIFEPSKSRLKNHGLLPEADGWDIKRINREIDFIILGMHARADNPELLEATALNIPVFSYPEYIYQHSKSKKRVVVGGSHGKTSITSMILHVMHKCGLKPDYLVGAQLKGFNTMVKLSDEAKVMIIEGDEYLSSPIQRIPKFHLYKPDIAVISGIAWDHINVFPTFEDYVAQFQIFTQVVTEHGVLIYNQTDDEVKKVAKDAPSHLQQIAYGIHPYRIERGITYLIHYNKETAIQVFGKHNLQNISAAYHVCKLLEIKDDEFYAAISSFEGAAKRLEKVGEGEGYIIFKDFAHSPSKLMATIDAVKEQFPDKKLIACMELHTFSSLNETFLNEYNGCMKNADEALVYYSPHTVEHKKLKAISKSGILDAFGTGNLEIFDDSQEMVNSLKRRDFANTVLLMMSSGNFDGLDLNALPELLIN